MGRRVHRAVRGEPGRAWDLYGGAGVLAGALVDQGFAVDVVETSGGAIAAGRQTLADEPVAFHRGDVASRLRGLPSPSVVVLDPPRTGAGAGVMSAIAASEPRAIVHVGCDPAAFARDLGSACENGYRLAELAAYDAFPGPTTSRPSRCSCRGSKTAAAGNVSPTGGAGKVAKAPLTGVDTRDMNLLRTIESPRDLRRLDQDQLTELAAEIRDFLVEKVSATGGHLGPNLGVVELTMAIHRVFDSPTDPVLFDTGHQAYVHKILTGRRDGFDTLRQAGGLSGYPCRAESEHDWVESSHASAALSYADGLAKAFALKGSSAPSWRSSATAP